MLKKLFTQYQLTINFTSLLILKNLSVIPLEFMLVYKLKTPWFLLKQ